MIRDERRVQAIWQRIKADEQWGPASAGMEETWDNVKRLIPKSIRMDEIATLEARYLREHPDSGYLTEILPLQSFPDYIDYLPHGSVARKIRIMGTEPEESVDRFLTLTPQELSVFVTGTVQLVLQQFSEKSLLSFL